MGAIRISRISTSTFVGCLAAAALVWSCGAQVATPTPATSTTPSATLAPSPSFTPVPTAQGTAAPVDGHAAQDYLAAADALNAATQKWGTAAESLSSAAAASTAPPADQLRTFVVAFLPLCHELAQAVRAYAGAVQALSLTADQRVIADELAAKAAAVAAYLDKWTDVDAFIADMGTADMTALDVWGGPWLDATTAVYPVANNLRAALGLPPADAGL